MRVTSLRSVATTTLSNDLENIKSRYKCRGNGRKSSIEYFIQMLNTNDSVDSRVRSIRWFGRWRQHCSNNCYNNMLKDDGFLFIRLYSLTNCLRPTVLFNLIIILLRIHNRQYYLRTLKSRLIEYTLFSGVFMGGGVPGVKLPRN